MNIVSTDLETFKKQLKSPNIGFDNSKQSKPKPKKNVVLSMVPDYTGCGHIRNILPSMFINSIYGKHGRMRIINTPVYVFQPDILQRTRSILFQRVMGTQTHNIVKHYKELQKQYKFKMVYDLDDFIWDGDDLGEEIPEYNIAKKNINKDIQKTAIENMKLMDIVCVSTKFLKDYIASKGIESKKILVVHNTLPKYLWNSPKRSIQKKIEKPRVLWTSSPTHWHDKNKLCGDMDNAWKDWIIKNVKEDKIQYIQMGGLPWFFEEIKDKIEVHDWVDCLSYPRRVQSINADFGIAPLVPNYFNYGKSPIKYQEYCMCGVVGIGTVFKNNKPSPYDVACTNVYDDVSVDELDNLVFNKLCEPDVYNEILEKQYQQVIDLNWTTESRGYINYLTKIL